jgi:hypothetical protein
VDGCDQWQDASRQQRERWHVLGPDDREVTPIKGGDLNQAKPLSYRHNGCIDRAQRHIGIGLDQVCHSGEIGGN